MFDYYMNEVLLKRQLDSLYFDKILRESNIVIMESQLMPRQANFKYMKVTKHSILGSSKIFGTMPIFKYALQLYVVDAQNLSSFFNKLALKNSPYKNLVVLKFKNLIITTFAFSKKILNVSYIINSLMQLLSRCLIFFFHHIK